MKIAIIGDVKTPARATPLAAGIDFFVPNDFVSPHYLIAGQSVLIASGIKAKIPKGFMLYAANKSGVAVKMGLSVGACVVGEDFEGEIFMHVVNTGDKVAEIKAGAKLVQFILVPVSYEAVEVVEELELLGPEVSQRGGGSLGSSGTD